ncbi:hypothetical protein F4780DRAFT_750418 [Xylariomycetidae sp. FL0641]|nr:hypothetical protein F4780DRAFT_750418 [Xylariomycetidae sp. FL0641]
MAAAHESTPLLTGGNGSGNGTGTDSAEAKPKPKPKPTTSPAAAAGPGVFGPANRILLAGFLMSFTLGITQVPIIYVFRLFECAIFYQQQRQQQHHHHHSPWLLFSSSEGEGDGDGDRLCHRREIDAGTATQVSVLGMSTSFSGVLNLFVCGYLIKRCGPRWAFVSQTALLGVRVSTQVLGATVGGRRGELIFQACQAIGIIGGPRGYQLVLNTAVSEVVAAKDRTAVFGRLQGSIMLGTAFGYLLGGVLGDVYTIRRPFETAFFLYVVSTIYGALFMPNKTAASTGSKAGAVTAAAAVNNRGISAFFAPLKIIRPHRYRLAGSGAVVRNYGLVFLALGIFVGVFASGYAPVLLQMYATAEFDFGTIENGYLMFGNSSIRGLFLLLIFPKLITVGRAWFDGPASDGEEETPKQQQQQQQQQQREHADGDIPTCPGDFGAAEGEEVPQEPTRVPDPDEEDSGTGFDLFFVRWSLVIDSLVTFMAGFSTQGWQVYLAGFLLPFASGSAPAAKGVMTEMCPPHQRADAISGITLVESTATLLTQGLFGMIFAFFSEVGRPSLTFFCNAGFAVIGFTTLFFARLPPANSKRIDYDGADVEASEDGMEGARSDEGEARER